MTEQEWLGEGDPLDLLAGIREASLVTVRTKAGRRKLRLLAVACCQRIEHLLPLALAQQSLEAGERWADGRLPTTVLAELRRVLAGEREAAAIKNTPGTAGAVKAALETTVWAVAALEDSLRDVAWDAANCALASANMAEGRLTNLTVRQDQDAAHRSLLRDIIGNPFRPASVNPAWLTPTVTSLAAAAYEERTLPSRHLDPARLAVLSDALEEAGCDNADILSHLRSSPPHVRGCWALDLVLGKS